MAHEKDESQSPPDHEQDEGARRRRWLMRPLVWVSGIVTAVVTALAVAGSLALVKYLSNPPPSPTGPPVAVLSVGLVRKPAEQGRTFVFPQDLSISSSNLQNIGMWAQELGTQDHYSSWARAHGGVDPKIVFIRLVLSGNRASSIRILDMNPVGTCSKPLDGTILYSPPSGQDRNVYVGFNLDRQSASAQVYNAGDKSFGSGYFDTHTISLKYQEQQVFHIAAQSLSRYCRFRIRLRVLEGKRESSEVIGNGKQPFQVTGLTFNPLNLSLARYGRAYVGGIATCNGSFIQVEPAKYRSGSRVCR